MICRKNPRGATLLLALLLLLACSLCGAAALNAASAGALSEANSLSSRQSYLAVSSAAKLIREQLGFSAEATYTYKPEYSELNPFEVVSAELTEDFSLPEHDSVYSLFWEDFCDALGSNAVGLLPENWQIKKPMQNEPLPVIELKISPSGFEFDEVSIKISLESDKIVVRVGSENGPVLGFTAKITVSQPEISETYETVDTGWGSVERLAESEAFFKIEVDAESAAIEGVDNLEI